MGVSCEVTKIQNLAKGGQDMVDTLKLKGAIVQNGKTQEDVARYLGIVPKTFYLKMKKGIFDSNEMEKMIDLLKIDDPVSIFFAKEVTSQATEDGQDEA